MIIYTHISIPKTLVSSQYITSKSSDLSQSHCIKRYNSNRYFNVLNRNGEQEKLIFSDSKKLGSCGKLGFRVGYSASSDGLSSDYFDNSDDIIKKRYQLFAIFFYDFCFSLSKFDNLDLVTIKIVF